MNLAIIDIDQTMFHTDCVVNVVRDGRVVRPLSSSEFNSYKLAPGEEYDFSDFRSTKSFIRTARPIPRVHEFVRSAERLNYQITYLTARGMVDDPIGFMIPFRTHDVPMAPVIFSGDRGDSPVENKRLVLERVLDHQHYSTMLMIDDHQKHLDMAIDLRGKYPSTTILTYLVKDDSILPYHG